MLRMDDVVGSRPSSSSLSLSLTAHHLQLKSDSMPFLDLARLDVSMAEAGGGGRSQVVEELEPVEVQ